MSNKMREYVGMRIGMLVCTEVLECEKVGKRSRTILQCVCDCGMKVEVRADLWTGKRHKPKSCGCILTKSTRSYNSLSDRRFTEKLKSYKVGAKARNLSWELTDHEAVDLFCLPCVYCGRMSNSNDLNQGNGKMRSKAANGIDRKNPKIGYVKENCVSCCGTCNRMKGIMNYEEYCDLIKQSYLNMRSNGLFK